jgi:MFS family permease
MVPMTFSKAYANLELGLNLTEATSIFSIIGFTGIFSALSISIISDKIGRKRSIVISNLALAAGLIGSAFFSKSFLEIAAWSVIVGVGYSSIWPLYAALVKDLYSWNVAGSITGFWTLLCGFGLLTSPYLCGVLIDYTGSYKPAYLLGSVVAITAILLILKIRTQTTRC